MRTGIVGLALALLIASATGVLAQETTGTITGRPPRWSRNFRPFGVRLGLTYAFPSLNPTVEEVAGPPRQTAYSRAQN